MAYKRYVKRGGKVCGPYYYESYRDKSGKVKKRYVGTTLPYSKKSVVPTNKKHFTKLTYDTKMLFVSHKTNKKQKTHKKIQIILTISLFAMIMIIGLNIYNNQINNQQQAGQEPGNLFSINFLRQTLLDLGLFPENLTSPTENITENATNNITGTGVNETITQESVTPSPEATEPTSLEATEPETPQISTAGDIGTLGACSNPISSCCGITGINSGTYYLSGSISDSKADQCIQITGANIILDCQSHTITYNNVNAAYQAIDITGNNITVKNCNIISGSRGINLLSKDDTANTFNNFIINNNIASTYEGIRFNSCNCISGDSDFGNMYGNVIENNTIISASSYGISLYAHLEYGSIFPPLHNNNFTNNNVRGNPYGLRISNSYNNNFKDSTFNGLTNDVFINSIEDSPSTNNLLLNCTLYNDKYAAFQAPPYWRGDITRKWYYRAYVNYTNGTPVSGAGITITGSEVLPVLYTGPDGYINKTPLTDYKQTGVDSDPYYTILTYQSYTVTATKGSFPLTHDINISLGNGGNNISDFFTFDVSPPTVTIVYPLNKTYSDMTQINYTLTVNPMSTPNKCWYTKNYGTDKYSIQNPGTNFTLVISVEGPNIFTVFCNDTIGNIGNSTVSFTKDSVYPKIFFTSYYHELSGTTYTDANASYVNRNYINIIVNASDLNLNSTWMQWQNSSGTSNETLAYGSDYPLLYSPSPLKSGLPDGNYNFTAFANDSANNVNSTEKRTVTVDTKYPAINFINPTPPNNNYTKLGSFIVNVSVYDLNFANITFYLYNNTNGLTLVNKTNYSLAYITKNSTYLNLNLPSDAVYYYNVSVIDLALNINTTEPPRTITRDTINPRIFFNPNTDTGDISKTDIFINITANDTNTNTVWFQWENQSGKYNLSFTNNAGDNYWISMPGLAQGTYNFTAFINDSAGNQNSTGKWNATVDLDFPLVNFVASTPADNSYRNTLNLFVNVSITTKNFANITFYLYNNTNTLTLVNNTTYTAAFNPPIKNISNITWNLNKDAVYYYNVSVFNTAGNNGFTELRTFTRDTINPLINYGIKTAPDYSNFSRNWIYVNVSVNETNTKNITFTLWDIADDTLPVNSTTFSMTNYKSNNTINWTNLFTDARHYIYYVNITDKANNKNSTSVYHITLDTTPPTITILSPLNTAEYSSATITFNVSVQGNTVPADACLFSLDNSINISMNKYNETNFYYNYLGISYDYHNITFSCNDSIGNWNYATTTRFLNKRTELPEIKDILFSYDDFITNTNTAELNKTITIKVVAEDNENLDLYATKIYINNGTGFFSINAEATGADGSPQHYTKVNYTATFKPDILTEYHINATVNNSILGGTVTMQGVSADKTLYVAGTTPLVLSSNYTNNKANTSKVDLTHKGIVYINYTIINQGDAAGYFPNLSIYGNPNIIAPVSYALNNVSIRGSLSKVVQVNVSQLTLPGTYTIIVNLTWTNADKTNSSIEDYFNIEVLENKSFVLTPNSISTSVIPGGSNSTELEINNTGNTALNNFNLLCTPGQQLCDLIDVTYNETNFNIPANNSRKIQINFNCPYGILANPIPGYIGDINISEQSISKKLRVTAIVPEKYEWSVAPDSINISKGYGQSGILREVKVSNGGTVEMTIAIASTDNAIISPNTTSIIIGPAKSANFSLSYNTPLTTGNYPVNIIIDNSKGVPSQMIIPINLNSTSLAMNILSTSITNVVSGDKISVQANASYSNAPLTDINPVIWEVLVGSNTCNDISSSYASAANIWTLNCTAPNLLDGKFYNLTARITYSTNGDVEKTKNNAVYYKDITPPRMYLLRNNINISKNINVTINVTDNVDVNTVLATLTYPNATEINLSLSFLNPYFVNTSLIGDKAGKYIVNITANDSVGNQNSTTGWFEVYDQYYWTIKLLDYQRNPVSGMNISLNDPSTEEVILNNKTDSSGTMNLLVNKRQYDIEGKTNVLDLFIRNVNFTNITLNNVNLNFHEIDGEDLPQTDPLKSTIPLYEPLKGIATNSTGFENNQFTITFNYTDLSYVRASFAIIKCSSWDYNSRTCTGSWSNISSSKDSDSKKVTGNDMDFKTYFIAENMCGDGNCDNYYSEDYTTCPKPSGDCPSPTTPPDNGGSTGGGGGGGGGSNPPVAAQDIGGIKLETTSIYKEMFPGESTTARIKVKNTLNEKKQISLRGSGNVAKFIFFESSTITLNPNEEKDILVKLVAPKDISVGNYDGDIILKSGDKEGKISATIRILSPEDKLLDLKIQPLVSTIEPGEILRLQTDLINLGKSNKVDINLDLQLLDIITGKIMARNEEKIIVQSSLSTIKNISIPADIKTGKYMLKGIAYYTNPNNQTLQANSISYVNVDYPILQRKILGIPVWNYLILIAIIIAIFAVIRYIRMLKYSKKRFKISVEMSKLPQPGPNAGFIGKVAETGIRTFIDMNKLQMHTLVAGSTGSGKTVAAQGIIEEALLKKKSVIVFDPTAQWTGFFRKTDDNTMLNRYKYYEMKEKDARAFNGTIKTISDPYELINIKKYLDRPGEITIFNISRLTPKEMDIVVASTIEQVFKSEPEESKELKTLIVYDEVHRLLPKFGGSGQGFVQLERGAREFRKWGIGLLLISQVLSDFIGEIKANIGTEIQMGTRYEGDLERVNMKYGEDVLKAVVKEPIGTGMATNAEYNNGRPYFVSFRPLLHTTKRLSNNELAKYQDYFNEVDDLEYQMTKLEGYEVDVLDLKLEIKLAKNKIKEGQFQMADMYLETLRPRFAEQWKALNKTPEHIVIEKISKEEVNKGVETAKIEREKFEKTNPPKEFSILEEIKKLKDAIEDKKRKGKVTSQAEAKLEDLKNRLRPFFGKKLNPKDTDGIKNELNSLANEINRI